MGRFLMIYKEAIHKAMVKLSEDERVVFIGQGLVSDDDPFYGTLSDIPKSKMLEMPCAEILSTGVAIGLALTGWIPVLLFQRMDFMLLAADQIINHAAMFPILSGGNVKIPMIIRACIGSQSEKFEVGIQHNKDFSKLFEPYMNVHYYGGHEINDAHAFDIPSEMTMIIEYKDKYNDEL